MARPIRVEDPQSASVWILWSRTKHPRAVYWYADSKWGRAQEARSVCDYMRESTPEFEWQVVEHKGVGDG